MVKKLLLLLVLVVLSSSFVAAGTVERSFNTIARNEVAVTLTMTYDGSEDRLIIEENYDPTLFQVIDSGDVDNRNPGVLKLVELNEPFLTSVTYTLSVLAGDGDYSFSGIYILSGTTEFPIAGDDTLTIINEDVIVGSPPAYTSSPSNIIELISCGNLDQEGATYLLNQDVITEGSECFDVQASNIVLDCQGNQIKPSNIDFSGNGIITGQDFNNIEIRNCKVSGFDEGIQINGNLNLVLKNNLFHNNNQGIDVNGMVERVSLNIVDTTSCSNNVRDFETNCISGLNTIVMGSGNFFGIVEFCSSEQLREGIHYNKCPAPTVALCTDGQTVNNCLCNTPGLEIVGDRCTSAVMKIRNVFDNISYDLGQKISVLASVLRPYFGLI